MDLSQFLDFLGEARYQLNSTIEYLQVAESHVIPQFVMFFDWFIVQATDQFLATLEITRNYGDTPPELRLQILYLLNELVVDRLSPEEVFYQLDQLNDREFPQIEEIFDKEEPDEEVKASGADSDGRNDVMNEFKVEEEQTIDQSEIEQNCDEVQEEGKDNELDESKSDESKSVDFKFEEPNSVESKSEESKSEQSESEESESEESKSNESNFDEPQHLRKLFIKGLSLQMTDEVVKAHFGQFGTVLEFDRAHDSKTNRFRSFGFITYSRANMVDAAQQASPHLINGRVVSARRDNPTIEDALKKRLQLAGLGEDVVEQDLRDYFVNYGNVVRVKIMNKRFMQRGCAFVQFDQYDPVERAVLERHHMIRGHVIEAKKTLLKREADSVEGEARDGGRNVPVWLYGSRAYNRGGNGGYSRGGGGFNGRNSYQSHGWNQQSRGQQHQQVGRSSNNGNSRYGNSSTGSGPIRRPNNRSTLGRYGNRIGNNR